MNQKKESPRFVLILGSLFLMAFVAFKLGSVWMDSASMPKISAIESPILTPTPNISQTPNISPTSVPLYWITPSITIGVPTAELQATITPELVTFTSTPQVVTPTTESTLASPTLTPSDILPTSTPSINSTATPTRDAYPGPEETDNPYPGPEETESPYPGPEITSTFLPTFTAVATGEPEQPNPTSVPSTTPQPTESVLTPTPTPFLVPTIPTATLTFVQSYTETQMLSDGAIHQAFWSQDALTLVLATSDGIYLVDAETFKREGIIDKGASIASITYAFNDGLIAAGGTDGAIRWWDPDTREYLGSLQGHLLGVVRMGIPNYGSYLVSGSDDATVRVWDISTMYNLGVDGVKLTFTFYEPQTRVTDLAVSSIGEMVAASSHQNVHIWNPQTGTLIKTIQQPSGWYTALALSPDSHTLATAYDGRRLEFWNTRTWERTKFLPLDGEVREIAYSDDGDYFAIGYEDGRIQIWDAYTKMHLAKLYRHEGLSGIAFSPNGDQLVSSSENGTMRFWDIFKLTYP